MSTADFFMENFGRHFIEPTGDSWTDVAQVLRGSYPMTGKASLSRMQSGWAIVRPGSATLQLDLAVPVIQKSRMTRLEAKTCFYTVGEGERFIVHDDGAALVVSACSGHGFKFGPVVGEAVARVAKGEADAAWLARHLGGA